MIKINLIGAGRLGQTLGRLLTQKQAAVIKGVMNRSLVSTQAAIAFMGAGEACQSPADLPEADLILITTSDDQIPILDEQLAQAHAFKPGQMVCHCSGALSTDELKYAKQSGAYVVSAHPMRSFSKATISGNDDGVTYCALEGDPEAVDGLTSLFAQIGWMTYPLKKDKKALYHAAGVFASNYLVTLAQQASLCLAESGVPSDITNALVTQLMQSTLHNITHQMSPAKALTGPLMRGDVHVIQRHLDALDEEARDLYCVLGQATLELTTLAPDRKLALSQRLSSSFKKIKSQTPWPKR